MRFDFHNIFLNVYDQLIIVCLIVVCERLSMRGLRGFGPQLKIYWTAAETEASIPLHAYFWYGHVRVALTRRSKNRSERKPSSPDRMRPAREANTRRGEEAACSEGPIFTFFTISDCA